MALNLTRVFMGTQKHGILRLNDEEGFAQQLQAFGDREIEVSVRLPKKTRSSAENRYYWAVPVAIVQEEYGFITPEQAHEWLKKEYNSEVVFIKTKNGLKEEKLPRSTVTTVQEFEAYCSRIRTGESFKGINIPEPNEVSY